MWGFLSVCALCGTAIYLYRESVCVLREFWAFHAPLPLTVPLESVAIPQDLHKLALAQSEPWAREQMLEAMQEQYRQTTSWNMVRTVHNLTEVV